MLVAGMYSPVFLPGVPDSTLVTSSTTAIAKRHTLTHKRDEHDNNNTWPALYGSGGFITVFT